MRETRARARRPGRRGRRAARRAAAVRRQGRRRRAPDRGRVGAKAEVRIEGSGEDAGSSLVLQIQNEHLVAIRDGEVVCSVPGPDHRPGRRDRRPDHDRGAALRVPRRRDRRARASRTGARRKGSRSSARATSATTSTSSPSRKGSRSDLRRAPEPDVARGRAARRRGRGRARHARIARAARPAPAAGDRLAARRAPGAGGRGAAARAGGRDAGRARRALDAPPRVRGLGDGASGRVSEPRRLVPRGPRADGDREDRDLRLARRQLRLRPRPGRGVRGSGDARRLLRSRPLPRGDDGLRPRSSGFTRRRRTCTPAGSRRA